MKALSIQQPWAWCIVYGSKRIENRTWRTDFRGRFYIHAGLKVDKDSVEDLRDEIERVPQPRPPAYRGALVGIATLVRCVWPGAVPIGQESWANGPWCFVLDDVQPLDKPIPFKGALGFFDIPDSVVEAALHGK